jgi:hypothetical protein
MSIRETGKTRHLNLILLSHFSSHLPKIGERNFTDIPWRKTLALTRFGCLNSKGTSLRSSPHDAREKRFTKACRAILRACFSPGLPSQTVLPERCAGSAFLAALASRPSADVDF